MPKQLASDRRSKQARYQLWRGRRGAHTAALYARVAELEAQIGAQRAFQAATPTERLNTLLAVSAALLVTHDIEAIMGLIVQRAVQLFPGANGALLFLAEEESGTLKLRAASSGPPGELIVQPGYGPAGRAFLSPRAMLLVGPEFELALDELDADQIGWLKRLLRPWPPVGALLAPLRIETQRIGALVLYGGTHAHMFIPRDLPFVQALADLAAVAIAETTQRERARLLQRNLTQSQSLHAETQARLDTAQAQLLQSAKLAAVGELAASVAHEINNPLYAARNSLYLVEQDLPPDAPQRQFLEIAQGELGRIARIITHMRDFYRPTRAELEPTMINDVLMATIDLVQTHLRHGQVAVATDLADDLPEMTAHTDQIRQVFLNLMLNACDAMPNGGTLRITSHMHRASDDHPAEIIVQIADTGVGIALEHQTHLFEPFYTTKAQGTGLGLAISAHIITQHSGQIEVASELGVGTTFTVRLPVLTTGHR
jgi:two-component system, NtrC family, sensor kinase